MAGTITLARGVAALMGPVDEEEMEEEPVEDEEEVVVEVLLEVPFDGAASRYC